MTVPLHRPRRESQPTSLEQRVGPELWQRMVGDAQPRCAAAGELIAGPAHDERAVAILDGTARIYMANASGRQTTLRYNRRGEVIGLFAMLSGWTSWGAEAMVPTRYVEVPLERLRSMLDNDPRFLRAFTEDVVDMATDAIIMVAAASSESMGTRIAGHLLETAELQPDGRLVARLTHQHLADITGTAREVVTRTLRRFREAGAIATEPSCIEILDRNRLLEAAGADEAEPRSDA